MIKADEELIAESLQGRTEAFGELVLRYQDRLFNSLVATLGSVEDARDVVQDAFIHAYEKLGSFRGQSAFYSWLFRIALNSSVNHHRKHGKNQHNLSLDGPAAGSAPEPSDPRPESGPEFLLERTEQQALVQRALMELPAEFRTVLVLKEMEGLKYEEIAAIVACPIGTVRSRIHRARSELRDKLSQLFKRERGG